MLELAIQAAVFMASVIKFRYFRAEMIGVLSYFAALAEIPPVFYGAFNRLMTRFMPTADGRHQAEIALASLIFQFGIFACLAAAALFLFAFFPALRVWETHMHAGGHDFAFVFWLTAAAVPLALFQGWAAGALNALQNFVTYQWLHLSSLSLSIAANLTVAFLVADRLEGMRILLWMQLTITGTSFALFALAIGKTGSLWKEMAAILPSWRLVCAEVYRAHVRGYTMPLQATALFGYLKENIAVLFLGQTGILADAGLYNMANKIYALPRKFVPSLVNVLMPKMVSAAKKDPEAFRKKYDAFTWAQFASNAALGTVIFLALPLIGRILEIKSSSSLKFVFYLFSLNLLINSVSQANLNIIMLGQDTRWFFVTSLVRSVFVVFVTAALIPAYKSAGASLALVLSSTLVAVMLAYETRKSNLLSWRYNPLQLALCLLVAFVWAIPMGIWSGVLPWN